MNTVKKTRTYLDQPYARIMWMEEGNAVHIEWKAKPSQEDYQQVLNLQREVIRKHGCMKVCLNSKALQKETSSH